MKLRDLLTQIRGSEVTEALEHRHIPFIVTPLETESDADDHLSKLSTPESGHSTLDDEPKFKHHHEASSIELFYDLFFVANLATFTVNHNINNGSTLRSYLGFFSLLWATWLQTSLFDVRFAYDSVFLRVCKAIHFGVQIGFVISGAVYSTDPLDARSSSFETLAIVQMASRLTLVIQYASVLWYIKGYPRTVVPLLATMAVLFAAAMVYLGTYFGFSSASSKVYYVWYVTAPIEIVLCVIISSVWRVLSFRHTHLVERVGLLTLIVIGEGVLGLSKSVSYLLQVSTSVAGRDVGVLIASVLLIYFIWMLYFDQIQNNRFGTIKQQIWALLHYPLHLCILFTVEGSTNLYIWNIVAPLYKYWRALMPGVPENSTFEETYPTEDVIITQVENAVQAFSKHFQKDKQLYKYYDYNLNITALKDLTNTYEYGSEDYKLELANIVVGMWQGVGNAIFEAFGVYPPKTIQPTEAVEGANASVQAEIDEFYSVASIFDVVIEYFYIAAGVLLVVLSLLYIIGNKRKTASEWFTIAFRVFMGTGTTMILVALVYSKNAEASANYLTGPWHVVVVMFIFFIVIVVDKIIVDRAIGRRRRGQVDAEKYQAPPRQSTGPKRNYSYTRANESEDTSYQPNYGSQNQPTYGSPYEPNNDTQYQPNNSTQYQPNYGGQYQ